MRSTLKSSLPPAKTLGILWRAQQDVLTFKAKKLPEEDKLTKRIILSQVAGVFDPLGLAGPFVVCAKILLQEMWTKGLDWDEPIDHELSSRAKTWFSELEVLQEIIVPRCLQESKPEKSFSVQTFVDASSEAYGAVSYLRSKYAQGCYVVRIIASKTRVCPLSPMSTPRLELMAAVLGLRLTLSILAALGISIDHARFWSDSMNVLYWIRGKGKQYLPFVANRIGVIQSQSNPEQWQYVETEENPADLCSRGLSASRLKDNSLWWRGPDFLTKHESEWSKAKIKEGSEVKTEAKRKLTLTSSLNFALPHMPQNRKWRLHPSNWSSWLRLTRVCAWVLRFVQNCRSFRQERLSESLSPEEIENAEILIIREAQQAAFTEEYHALQENKLISKKSRLKTLVPLLDEDGLIRCDGRLRFAEFLPYDMRFPIILPRGSWTTKLIVKHFHEAGHHVSGTNHILANLSTKYWIPAAREEIRQWENECNECKRRKARVAQQIMAPLPLVRLRLPLRAFVRVSVDYGGPFITVQGRGKRREKRWLCLFTCLTCRAVHLEMSFGLDTDSFLKCFVRMASRQGYPQEIVSDRGTNFIGADRELRELLDALDRDKIKDQTVNKGVKWFFNPPLAPHFGGVHEVMIKAAKRAIRAILSDADVNDEELMTTFTGVEALMNSRPLTYQSANPKDVTPLTPNHFLYGQAGGLSAPASVDEKPFNPRKRWRRIQELISHFWKR